MDSRVEADIGPGTAAVMKTTFGLLAAAGYCVAAYYGGPGAIWLLYFTGALELLNLAIYWRNAGVFRGF